MFERQSFLWLNIFVIILSLIGSIETICEINYPLDETLRPNLYTKVGSHKIKLNYNFQPNKNYYNLFDGQEVEAECDITFNKPIENEKYLFIKCSRGRLSTKSNYYKSYKYVNNFFECSKLKWKLYESLHNFSWCSTNVTSYIMARPNNYISSEYKFLAGICYDIYNFSFKSLYYTLAPGNAKFAEPKTVANFYVPNNEINYIEETFGINNLTESDLSNNQQFRKWLEVYQFQYNSMVSYSSFNDQFKSILDFVWWSNLRLYNWNNYQVALEAHVERENVVYDILAGISGSVKVPYLENCQYNYSMKELHDDKNRKIPMFVWHYLQSRNDSTKDIVVIGFNSPFYEFHLEKDIIFCPDKCQEIPWLKQMSFNFRRSTMGIVFCCNVEDVKTSKRLSEFPESDINVKPVVQKEKIPFLVKAHNVYDDDVNNDEDELEQVEY